MSAITVLIADDHEIVRYGIYKYLSTAEDIEVVAQASTGKECIELFKKEKPDICMLDIGMPDKDGIEIARTIRQLNTNTKILILSMHINKQILSEALEADINGYLLKNTDKADILNGIRAIMNGQQVFSDPISDLMKKSFLKRSSRQQDKGSNRLTNREHEILDLIVKGYTSKEIAQKLYISPRTVDTHRANLMEKLELNNIAELVRYAIKNELVSSP